MSRKSDMAVRAAALAAGRAGRDAQPESDGPRHRVRDIILVAGAVLGALVISSLAVLLYLA